MQAAGGQAQHHVARDHGVGSIEDFGFLNRADAKASQIVLTSRIHSGHLGRFAANQGAAAQFAAFGDACDHGCRGVHIELATGEVIQEEQGLSPLHQHVVDAHRH